MTLLHDCCSGTAAKSTKAQKRARQKARKASHQTGSGEASEMASEDTQDIGNINGTAAHSGNPLGGGCREVHALHSAHGMLIKPTTGSIS